MGPSSPKALRAVGAGAKTTSILSSNFYGWFQRVARACYQVTESGRAETARFPEIHAQALDALKSCDGST